MKKITEEITNWLEDSTLKMSQGLATKDEEIIDFKSRFSKEKLKECLTDSSLDAEDLESIEDMIEFFFGEDKTNFN